MVHLLGWHETSLVPGLMPIEKAIEEIEDGVRSESDDISVCDYRDHLPHGPMAWGQLLLLHSALGFNFIEGFRVWKECVFILLPSLLQAEKKPDVHETSA